MNILEFDHVTKVYRKGFTARKVPAVTDLSFTVSASGITGFVGPNGAGKTTTIKMALGLVHPTSGSVLLSGRPADSPGARRAVAFVPEQPAHYAYLTVRESLSFAYRLYGRPRGGMSGHLARAAERMGLARHMGKKTGELSKGLQQRLSFGQALLSDARLYVLDEPMSGMDPPGRRLFADILRELSHEGKTVFFSSHVLEDIRSLCDRVVALAEGSLVYSGDIPSLLAKGYMGTDMTVPEAAEPLRTALQEAGCRLEDHVDGTVGIFVPEGVDRARCQDLLHEHGTLPVFITPRNRPLESLLYPERTEGKGT
jgi:ABC-2 type transport system ATP-binding protein